jgi:hypothetical protein
VQIKPTIGRVVWFYPQGHREGVQPHAALIAFVHSDKMINLGVFDSNGHSYSETSVPLLQEGDAVPDEGRYATWMPFQIGQAEKNAAKETDKDAAAVDGLTQPPSGVLVAGQTNTVTGGDSVAVDHAGHVIETKPVTD